MHSYCPRSPALFAGKLWLAFAILFLSACSTRMPTRQSGFLSDYHRLSPAADNKGQVLKTPVPLDPAHTVITEVEWRVGNDSLSPAERTALLGTLRAGLQSQLARLPAAPEGRQADIRAAITDISTVSPSLNVMSTAMFAVPLDRGGAAVEIEAVDHENHQQLAALNLGYYPPITDLQARFSKLAPARIALDKASGEFGPLLRP